MTIYLRVFKTMKPNAMVAVKIYDHMFAPIKRGEVKPVYEYRLPPELEAKMPFELLVWYREGLANNTLPPSNIAAQKPKREPEKREAKVGHRERPWRSGDAPGAAIPLHVNKGSQRKKP